MNTHKLFNGLAVLTLLLPTLLTGSPMPTQAAPPPPYALNVAEVVGLNAPFSDLSAASDSLVQSSPAGPVAVSGGVPFGAGAMITNAADATYSVTLANMDNDFGAFVRNEYQANKMWLNNTALLTDVVITGPAVGVVNVVYAFTATVTPITATMSITYAWYATRQSSVTHITASYTDTVTFMWAVTGTQAITVTATNADGTISATHTITTWTEGWVIECADCPKYFTEMSDRSLRLDTAGHPHIVYGDDHLYHAWQDGVSWHLETVDSAPGVGQYASLALDESDYPHISHYDDANDDLRYTYQDAVGWHSETVDNASNVGSHTSLALDGSGYPHISYYDDTNDDLKYAYLDASGWHSETVDSVGSVGNHTSLILDGSGYPHISYHDISNDDLKYAYKDVTDWHTETVDSDITWGGHTSLALDGDSYPHISYYTNDDLKYAYKDVGGWQIETVDSAGGVGLYTSLALDGSGYPHVSYKHWGNRKLKYAYQDVGGWHTEVIDSSAPVGSHTSLALDGNGYPHIGYQDWGSVDLKYAFQDASGWHIELVDGEGPVGGYNSLALDGNGYPHISYFEGGNDNLRYAYQDVGGWHIETVDSEGSVGLRSSLVLDGNGYPHISYRDSTNKDLKYAYLDAPGWYSETVDSEWIVGGNTSLALDGSGYPHIGYRDGTNKDLKYAYLDASEWQGETVDSAGDVGEYPSLALDENGYPHISYYDNTNKNLEYAYHDASGWHFRTVDSVGNVGEYTSLALDRSGYPHISYWDSTNEDLKYAYQDAFGWHIETVDSEGSVGKYTSLVLDRNSHPHISYSDMSNHDLKYAYYLAAPSVPILTGVSISGPTAGTVDTAYTFTATVSPVTATLPITYSWQVAGQSDVVTMKNTLSHTVTFTWSTTGTQDIVVTANNAGGTVSDTHIVTITHTTCWARLNDDLTDYTTVQAAVDAANEGDVVKVAGYCFGVEARAGVTQTVYISKSLTLRGGYTTTNWTTSDPEANPTTLDAEGQGRVLYITGDIAPTIEGLRVTGGDATGLGGDPHYEEDAGGGLYIITATATISNNQVFGNTARIGGGLFLLYSAAGLSGSIITANTAYGGGGLYLVHSDATFNGNILSSNTTYYDGAGLYLYASDVTLRDNSIISNTAGDAGGGLRVSYSAATFSDNVVASNTAHRGGGLFLYGSTPTFTNNILIDNRADDAGSGLYIDASSPRLLHTTIARNSGGDGSGVYVTDDEASYSTVALTNTILVSHSVGISVTGGNTAMVNGILWDNDTPITVSWSITAAVIVQNQHIGDPAFATDGYHLTVDSAAIDHGVASAASVTTDIDGQPRPMGAGYDLGADEFSGSVVTPTAVIINGPMTGTINTAYTFTATVFPLTATLPITYVWQATGQSPVTHAGSLNRTDTVTFTWSITGTQVITITATNAEDTVSDTHAIIISAPPPDCPHPLEDVSINGPNSGYIDTLYALTTVITPSNVTEPITYTWSSDGLVSGQGTASATYSWAMTGVHTASVAVVNCGGFASADHAITLGEPPPSCDDPLTGVSVSGPMSGERGEALVFSADVIPANATTPLTYVWSSDGLVSGQGTESASYEWATPGVYTITLVAENCGGTATNTHTVAISASPSAGDAYESDDTCEQAQPILTDGFVQVHNFHTLGDADWVSFQVISGTEYIIEALTPATSTTDMVLELYDACGAVPTDTQDYDFSPDVRLQFQAPSDGTYYLRLNNHNPNTAGPDVTYHLSVRALVETSTPGALVLVAGRLRLDDPLQPNIHNVTNAVYRLFQAHDYGDDRIYYLATDLNLDADGDGWDDVDVQANWTNLEQAITQWAVDKVGPDRAFTLYLMDHGGYDRFYLNGPSQKVSPDDIDAWLDMLETAAPGVKVNVIVEACHSGSFIDLVKSVSQEGRVVIASTGAYLLAHASQNGAIFSDAFVGALGRGMSLYSSFEEGKWTVQQAHPGQTPWLDDDGDGMPNEAEDGQEAQRRGFAYAGTLVEEEWPPYVVWAQVRDVEDGEGVIEAEVRDDQGVGFVWAVVYKPSYEAPDPEETEEMPQENLPTVTLLDQNGDDVYTGLYGGFDEVGEYRVVVYAVDNEELQGRPKEMVVRTGWLVYLPVVLRSD